MGGAEFDGGFVEGGDATGDISDQVRVRAELRFVEVEAADPREEDLAFETEFRGGGDEARDGAELLTEASVGERGGER